MTPIDVISESTEKKRLASVSIKVAIAFDSWHVNPDKGILSQYDLSANEVVTISFRNRLLVQQRRLRKTTQKRSYPGFQFKIFIL